MGAFERVWEESIEYVTATRASPARFESARSSATGIIHRSLPRDDKPWGPRFPGPTIGKPHPDPCLPNQPLSPTEKAIADNKCREMGFACADNFQMCRAINLGVGRPHICECMEPLCFSDPDTCNHISATLPSSMP